MAWEAESTSVQTPSSPQPVPWWRSTEPKAAARTVRAKVEESIAKERSFSTTSTVFSPADCLDGHRCRDPEFFGQLL